MEDFSLPHILTIFNRWYRHFLVTFAALLVLTTVIAASWSNYRSETTVEIKRPEIPQNLIIPGNTSVEDTIVTLTDEHIIRLKESVTSLESLTPIIEKFNLYKGTSVRSAANEMRRKIRLELVNSPVANPMAAQKKTAEQLSAIAFVLSFDYSDPLTAQKVTEELTRRFIEEDIKARREKAQATSDFLASQLKIIEASIAEQEQKIADFKLQHGESGPTAFLFNQQASVNINLDLRNIESQITANEGTQGSLKTQLATIDPYSRVIADGQVLTTPAIQLKAMEAQYSTLSAHYGPDYPDLIKLRGQIEALKHQTGNVNTSSQLQAQIKDIQTNLAAAKSSKGSDNPDVVALKRQLASLEKRLATAQSGRNDDIKSDADNPAYLALTAQLHSTEEQHKSLVEQRDVLRAQQTKYQSAIAENPGIEQQMAALSRDYENAKTRYSELKEKKMAADLSLRLEGDKKMDHLVVTQPPSLPTHTHPGRLLIILTGFICSLIGGAGVTLWLEALNQSVYGAQQLAAITGMQPIAMIPYIYTARERERKENIYAYIKKIARFLPQKAWQV